MRLYDSLSHTIREFVPINDTVRVYCCGPTVYNYAHIGNLRTYIFEDLLRRTLDEAGFAVNHVMNVTDVGHLTGDDDHGEDKMVKSAREKLQSVKEIAAFYEKAFFNDCLRLNILKPYKVCLASEHVDDMIALIEKMMRDGYAYPAGGNVYFDTSRDSNYGALRGYAGQGSVRNRVAADEAKRNAEDFALWFTKSKFEGQAMTWESPWGAGYPGWHIECSAMSARYLGVPFDIHCGGVDHVGVHHTNEMAQNRAAFGHHGANYWIHGEFLTLGADKMSKSSGEFLTLQSLADEGFDPLDYRYFCLTAHYRSRLTFTREALSAAKNARKKLVDRAVALMKSLGESDSSSSDEAGHLCKLMDERLFDDLDSGGMIALLWTSLKNSELDASVKLSLLKHVDQILALGLFEKKNEDEGETLPSSVIALLAERTEARAKKDFALSDLLRDKIDALGYSVKDAAAGQICLKK